ncbi:hypothetical protein [Thermogemmatispora aurantia]|uniref:hypothetical protein n=1 Tax=Thermogemmatispora aurantia TaxID=2045279 RepID=UPI00124BD509|nr:hypothetical protein [Thermogemmatispora aurantia]
MFPARRFESKEQPADERLGGEPAGAGSGGIDPLAASDPIPAFITKGDLPVTLAAAKRLGQPQLDGQGVWIRTKPAHPGTHHRRETTALQEGERLLEALLGLVLGLAALRFFLSSLGGLPGAEGALLFFVDLAGTLGQRL